MEPRSITGRQQSVESMKSMRWAKEARTFREFRASHDNGRKIEKS